MALSSDERKRLLKADLPASKLVRGQLQDYLRRTGLGCGDFARRINYSTATMEFFASGKYHSIAASDRAIRSAILDFIATHPIGGEAADEQGKLYETENVRLLRKYFYEALNKGWGYVVYGAPGCQKTWVLQRLTAELNRAEVAKNGTARRAFRVYCRAGIRPGDLMKRVAEAAGTFTVGNADRILRNLRFDFSGRRVLIAFDEAQHLDNSCLETVRELLDEEPHCGLLFVGSHNLKAIFEQTELEQLRSRMHAAKALPGISDDEARKIVAGEIGTDYPERRISGLIEAARVEDPRQGKDYRYISARKLFWSLHDLKVAIAEKNRGQTEAAA